MKAAMPLPQARAEQATADADKAAKQPDAPRQLLLGLVFGIVFGFLLQKGGVAKYEILMGALLLTDFTVMKIMLSAIVVGMVGIFGMHALGLVRLHVKKTQYPANIMGGLLFGAGFALLGYCPGTGAAALGQGNFDALAGMVGMLAGSHLFAELSHPLASVQNWGNRGRIMLNELIGVPLRAFLPIIVPTLVFALWMLEHHFG